MPVQNRHGVHLHVLRCCTYRLLHVDQRGADLLPLGVNLLCDRERRHGRLAMLEQPSGSISSAGQQVLGCTQLDALKAVSGQPA